MREAEAVLMMFMFFTVGFIFMVYMISRYLRRKLEHREILAAIEHGQPLPMRQPKKVKRTPYANDLRTGTLLVNFAIGFALFLWFIDGQEAMAVSFVPLFIGLGYLLNAALTKRLKLENGDGNGNNAVASYAEAEQDSIPVVDIPAEEDELSS